jgi:hypothetical protein
VDGLASTAIDIYEGENRIHNVFVVQNNRVYLFVMRNPTAETRQMFDAMLSTVRLFEPEY